MRALVFAIFLAVIAAPITAFAAESHVWLQNSTDKSVWITAFTGRCVEGGGREHRGQACTDRHIVHEWCTAPGQLSKQGFHVPLTVVHVLVTAHPNCGRPVIKEWTLNFPANNGSQSIKQQYIVRNVAKAYDVQTLP